MEDNFEKLQFNLCENTESLRDESDPDNNFFDEINLKAKYITIDEAKAYLSQKDTSFSLLCLNIRSI